jgi:hypothetical protein
MFLFSCIICVKRDLSFFQSMLTLPSVETSKSDRQSSYPKAGLILRTSSFKDSGSSGDSREGSTERTVTMKTSTRTVAGETFLTNRSKVTGVQDVISRMKSEGLAIQYSNFSSF